MLSTFGPNTYFFLIRIQDCSSTNTETVGVFLWEISFFLEGLFCLFLRLYWGTPAGETTISLSLFSSFLFLRRRQHQIAPINHRSSLPPPSPEKPLLTLPPISHTELTAVQSSGKIAPSKVNIAFCLSLPPSGSQKRGKALPQKEKNKNSAKKRKALLTANKDFSMTGTLASSLENYERKTLLWIREKTAMGRNFAVA